MSGKLILTLALVGISAHLYLSHLNSQSREQTHLRTLFESWKNQYSKSYSSLEEESARFDAFVQNFHTVNEVNAQKLSYTLGLTKFADLTLEEFSSIYTRPFPTDDKGNVNCPSNNNCPDLPPAQASTLNWTAVGAVTPVKDMKQCGDVFAFTATASLEAVNFFNTNNLVSFSEQQICDCDTQNDGCNGGYPYLALTYTAQYGIETEAEYPYKGITQKCHYNASLATHLNTGYTCVQPKSVDQMMSAASIQPVGVCVNAATQAWQLYKGGVLSGACSDQLDHCLALTGYGSYESKSAWFLKNEWGPDWGVNGYVYLSQSNSSNSGYGECGVLACSVYATTNSSMF